VVLLCPPDCILFTEALFMSSNTGTGNALALAAHVLREARATRTSIGPISISHGISGLDAAYEVAAINTQARIAEGARVVGLKVGLTSKAVQQQLGVNQPDFGVLFQDMEYLNDQDVPMSRLMQPKVEAEIAFVVGRDLISPTLSYCEFLAAITYALPAIEIVDSAITDWKITLVDTVADNASCGLYVLGDQPVAIGQLALGDLGMSMTKNGQIISVGTGAACLGHPLRAAYWLAQTMSQRGRGLKAGEVILSGALGPMVPVSAGDLIQARIGALGSVSCRMV
jgi:2-keto-4-pentenoate hydratase